ncbi:MAG: DUF5818 domain-containing protein [Terracidiphilus sp.]
MKSTFKCCLFGGIALSLAVLTARRFERQQEIEGSLDRPQPDEPNLLPSRAGNGNIGPLPGVSGGSGSSLGPLPHSPNVSVTFSGTVVRNGARLALREVAGVLYPLDGTPKAWSFEGANVRVSGKMDLATRMLHVDAIEPAAL